MKKEIKNARFDVLTSSKHSNSHSHSLSLSSSLDENSKKIQKLRIKIKDSKLNKSTPASLQMDMKSVRVLVERTKFNVMLNLEQNLEHNKSLKCSTTKQIDTPLKKLTNKNAPLASSTPQRQQSSPEKLPSKTQPAMAQHQQTIDEIFKIRKCCIKLPKDKLILQLQEKQVPYPVKLIVHRPRGRPRKDRGNADNLLMVDSPSTGQKRKSSEKQTSVSPPKRKLKKANEFFIKINSLTRVASPRRVLASNSLCSEDKPPLTSKQRRKSAKKLNTKTLTSSRLAPLRQKFGSRFFKAFVKIKRIASINLEQPTLSCSPPKTDSTPKKKNGKNLTVSFLETVEIFGESSDDDDWFESDAKNASRSIKAPMDSLFDSLKTSTPCIRSSSSASNNSNSSSSTSSSIGSGSGSGSGILKSSILDRKEKKSFSPLKETESPRKQQLKLANESFVPRSLDTQIDEEERDIAEDITEESESAVKSSTLPESGIVNDIEHKSSNTESQSNESEIDTSAPELSSTNKPLTSDDKTDEEQSEGKLNSSNEPNEPTPMEQVPNSTEDEVHAEEEEEDKEDAEEETTEAQTTQDNDDSFRSAATSLEDSVGAQVPEEPSPHRSPSPSPSASQTAENDEETEENIADNEAQSEGEPEPEAEAEAEAEADAEEEPSADQNEEPQEDEANHDEISKDACPDDEEPFVDPSKLVASVLLHDSTEEGRNEAEAVLNDVCQMAAAESAVLLTPAGHLAYSSPHSAMDDDDDDDFNSVLTHPQTEKTLQSAAASDLVPNSQEIAVEAAVVSQATLVAPTVDDVIEDTFASVVAEVERFTKDVNSEIYANDVGITGADVMMDNVQVRHSLDDIFDDDVDDDIMSSLRISSGSIDIGHDKSLPIQVIETEVMAIPNEPDLIFDKPLGTTASSLISNGPQLNDTLPVRGVPNAAPEPNTKLFGRLFQSVKSYVMSPGGEKNASLQD